MSTQQRFSRLIFLTGFTDEQADEARSRGYVSHVLAETDDALLYALTFYDATRLSQDLEEQSKHGTDFIADPAMIVLREITETAMKNAVRALCEHGFFRHFQPVDRAVLDAAVPLEWPPPR